MNQDIKFLKDLGFTIDHRGYGEHLRNRIVRGLSNNPFKDATFYDWAKTETLVFTQGFIGKEAKKEKMIRDYCFVSVLSFTDRVMLGGGSGRGEQVNTIYCHKDSIENCPDLLPDDSILKIEEIKENEHGLYVSKASIIWIRPEI